MARNRDNYRTSQYVARGAANARKRVIKKATKAAGGVAKKAVKRKGS